jgi:hypothetical protein
MGLQKANYPEQTLATMIQTFLVLWGSPKLLETSSLEAWLSWGTYLSNTYGIEQYAFIQWE